MTARRAQRAAVVLVAAVVAVWFAFSLRARHDTNRAQSAAQTTDLHSPAAVRRLEALYRKAERLNADPAPRIGEASLDLALGRRARGVAALEQVARSNPGNLPARLLLARAYATAGQTSLLNGVDAQLRTLYGRVGARSARLSIRDGQGRLLPVVTDWVETPLDGIRQRPGGLLVSGAAFSRPAHAPADEIVVFVRGHLLQRVKPTIPRRDVSDSAHLPPGLYGFILRLPRGVPRSAVEMYAVQGGIATAVPLPPA